MVLAKKTRICFADGQKNGQECKHKEKRHTYSQRMANLEKGNKGEILSFSVRGTKKARFKSLRAEEEVTRYASALIIAYYRLAALGEALTAEFFRYDKAAYN
uniref:Uncharacterized protein n=1 Tax=Romanomermis culicivorax TaxID=13658 RepID=A0A915HRQ4_ROMCU